MNVKAPASAAGLTRLDEPQIVSAGNEKTRGGGHSSVRSLGCYRHAFAIGLALLGTGQIACAADVLPRRKPPRAATWRKTWQTNFAEWFDRVKATQADQPSWAAPLNTVTPLLKEFAQYRLSDPAEWRQCHTL